MNPSPPFRALLLFSTALAWAGCGDARVENGAGGVAPGPAPAGTIRVGVLPRAAPAGFWKSVESGAKRAADELKVELVWKAPLRDGDREQQALTVESLATDGIHGLALDPVDARALRRAIQETTQGRVPVVILGTPLDGQPGRDFGSVVSPDPAEGGRKAGQEMAHLLKGRGRIVVLRHQDGSVVNPAREAGFLEVVRRQPGISVLADSQLSGSNREAALVRAEQLLDRLREADGIFTSSDTTTAAMLEVLRRNGLAGKAFIGFDGATGLLAGLEEGYLRGLVIQNPDRMGYEGVRTLVAAVRRQPVPPRVDTGVALVIPENRRSPEIKAMLGEN